MRKTFLLLPAKRVRFTNEELAKHSDGTWLKVGECVRFTEGKPKGAFVASYVKSVGQGDNGYFMRVHTLYSKRGGVETHNHPSLFVQMGSRSETIDDATMECFLENVALFVQNSKEAKAVAQDAYDEARDDPSGELALRRAESDLVAAECYRNALADFIKQKDTKLRFPVWYSSEKVGGKTTVYRLSFSQLSRTVYPQTPRSLSQQCVSADSLCPACSLFGFVPPEGSGTAVAGRVRFSDAFIQGSKDVEPETRTLATLLSPRQSSFEFYLRNPDNPNSFTADTPGTVLAGRKSYWHHSSGENYVLSESQTVTQFNKKAELVGKGTKFAFDVFVDDVTSKELNQLIYALTFGQWWGPDGSKELYCHKLGHGKPIGLGSAYVAIESIAMRTYDESGEYKIEQTHSANESASWKFERDGVELTLSSVKAVKAVSDFTAISNAAEISYPASTESGDIFEWFASNRELNMRDSDDGIIKYAQVLPTIYSLDQNLERNAPANKRSDSRKQGGNGVRKSSTQAPSGQSPDRRAARGPREYGEIKTIHKSGLSGHIKREGNDDIFFYVDNVEGGIPKRGVKVSFVVGKNNRGPCARDIRIEQ